MLVCRHVSLRPPVYQVYVLYARAPLGCPGRIHGRIAASDHHHTLAKIDLSLRPIEFFQKLQRISYFLAIQLELSPLIRAYGKNNRIIFFLKFRDGSDFPAIENLNPQFLKQSGILFNHAVINPKVRNHCAHDSAQLLPFLIDGDVSPHPCQIEGCRHAGWPAANDGHLLMAAIPLLQG